MATVEGSTATLLTAATGNVTSDVGHRSVAGGPAAVVITSTVGATPTVTVNIQGSVDGTNFYNIPYALVATPETLTIAAITITTATTTTYLLRPDHAWTFVRLVLSANTNVTLSATAYM